MKLTQAIAMIKLEHLYVLLCILLRAQLLPSASWRSNETQYVAHLYFDYLLLIRIRVCFLVIVCCFFVGICAFAAAVLWLWL